MTLLGRSPTNFSLPSKTISLGIRRQFNITLMLDPAGYITLNTTLLFSNTTDLFTANQVIVNITNASPSYNDYIFVNLNFTNQSSSIFNLLFNNNATGFATGGLNTGFADIIIDILHTSNVSANINGSSSFFTQSGFYNYTNQTTNFTNQLQSYLNNCTADSNGLCNVPINLSGSTSGGVNLTTLNVTYIPFTGLYTRARDAATLALLNDTTLVISNGTTQVTGTLNFSGNDTVFFPYSAIPTGSVTLTYSKSGYADAIYFTTINSTSQVNITALLQNTSVATAITVTFTISSSAGSPIQGATISIFRPVNGSYSLQSQGTSDGAGGVTFVLDSSITYLINVSATGFNSLSQTLRPTQSAYTIFLTESQLTPFQFPASNLYYILLPYILTPSNITGLQTFNFTLSAKDNSISEQGIFLTYVNGTILNFTTTVLNPNGTTLRLTWNMTNWTQSLILIGNFTRNGEVGSDIRVYLNNSFFNFGGNSSITDGLGNFNDSSTGPGYLLKGIFGLILLAIFAATLLNYTNSPPAASLATFVFATVLTLFGFFTWGVWIILLLALLGLLYFVYKG